MQRIRSLIYDKTKKEKIIEMFLDNELDSTNWPQATDADLVKYFDRKLKEQQQGTSLKPVIPSLYTRLFGDSEGFNPKNEFTELTCGVSLEANGGKLLMKQPTYKIKRLVPVNAGKEEGNAAVEESIPISTFAFNDGVTRVQSSELIKVDKFTESCSQSNVFYDFCGTCPAIDGFISHATIDDEGIEFVTIQFSEQVSQHIDLNVMSTLCKKAENGAINHIFVVGTDSMFDAWNIEQKICLNSTSDPSYAEKLLSVKNVRQYVLSLGLNSKRKRSW